MFLSTSEPLELDGRSQDPQKSLCNPQVFNTAISRAKSHVVAIGNPFMLLKIEEIMGSRRKCWREYIKLCLKCNQIFFPKNYDWRARSQIIAFIMQAIDTDNVKSLFLQERNLNFQMEPEEDKVHISQVVPPINPRQLEGMQLTPVPKIKSYAQVVAHNTTVAKKSNLKSKKFNKHA